MFAVLGIWASAFVGVDFTDEVFAHAMSKKLITEKNFFLDEFDLHQSTALITNPILKTYQYFNEELSGYYLFNRILYLLILASLLLFVLRNTSTSKTEKILLFCLCAMYTPAGFGGIGYITLSYLCCLFILMSFYKNNDAAVKKDAILLFVLAALLATVYPSFMFSSLFLIGGIFISQAEKKNKAVAAAIGMSLFCYYLIEIGPEQLTDLNLLKETMGFNTLSYQTDVFARAKNAANRTPDLFIFLTVIISYIVKKITNKKFQGHALVSVLLISTVVLLLALEHGRPVLDHVVFNFNSVILGFGLIRLPTSNKYINLGIIASAPIVVLSSNYTGVLGLNHLLTPMSIFSIYFHETKQSEIQKISRAIALPLILIITILTRVMMSYDQIGNIELRPIADGFYSGVFSTEAKQTYLKQFEDLTSRTTNGSKIFISHHFPVGYLISKSREHSPVSWYEVKYDSRPQAREQIRKYFIKNGAPDYVVALKYVVGKIGSRFEYDHQKDSMANELVDQAEMKLVYENEIGRLYEKSSN